MKINFIDTPRPMIIEFTMFEQFNFDKLKEDKTVTVTIDNQTKTRVKLDLQHGQARFLINRPVEGFKTFEQSRYSYADYKTHISNYFIVSKKQDKEALKKYITAILNDVFKLLDIDELNVKLIDNFKNWK